MRTTIEIGDELLRRAKRRAADDGTSFRAIVEAALRSYLAGSATRPDYTLRWSTERGTLRPGIDLDDRNSLFEAMDEDR